MRAGFLPKNDSQCCIEFYRTVVGNGSVFVPRRGTRPSRQMATLTLIDGPTNISSVPYLLGQSWTTYAIPRLATKFPVLIAVA